MLQWCHHLDEPVNKNENIQTYIEVWALIFGSNVTRGWILMLQG